MEQVWGVEFLEDLLLLLRPSLFVGLFIFLGLFIWPLRRRRYLARDFFLAVFFTYVAASSQLLSNWLMGKIESGAPPFSYQEYKRTLPSALIWVADELIPWCPDPGEFTAGGPGGYTVVKQVGCLQARDAEHGEEVKERAVDLSSLPAKVMALEDPSRVLVVLPARQLKRASMIFAQAGLPVELKAWSSWAGPVRFEFGSLIPSGRNLAVTDAAFREYLSLGACYLVKAWDWIKEEVSRPGGRL